jgi:hypothetical protein
MYVDYLPTDSRQGGRTQGINLKGCMYFIRKGNLKFSLSK